MKIKIIFVLPSLRAGGAERVMSFVASYLNKDIFETSLLITGSNIDQSYTIPDHTPVRFLNKSRVKHALPAMAKHIYCHKPHIVIGAIGHVNFALSILAIFFRKIKFIGRETSVITAILSVENKNPKKNIFPDPRPLTLDKIVCQSEDMKNDLIQNFNYPKEKIVIINNPITSKFHLKEETPSHSVFQVISIGRMTKVKGFERLLKILRQIDFPFHYTLIGDGKDKNKIISLIHTLGLQNQVTHIPFTNAVEKYLAASHLYLSGSYVEGFPNVFLESCAVGTPVLAFKAPGGINEIIIEGVNGYTVDTETEYLVMLEQCAQKSWEPKKVRKSVLDRFSEKKILREYESLFQNVFGAKIE